MVTGQIPSTMLVLGELIYHFASADLGNAILEFVGGCLIFLHTKRAWKDQEIKGVHWGPFVFFWTWGVYNLWYYAHIGQPISGYIAFMPCLANTAYLFSFWLFNGSFNYDRRNDRARWWVLTRINRFRAFWGAALEEAADLPT